MGAKVYANGRLLFQKQIARGIKRDEDQVPVHLNAGPNNILFKVEQGNGGWGLLARLADAHGKGLTNVSERLEIGSVSTQTEEPGLSWLRRAAGRQGTLDLAAAANYDMISVREKRWVDRFQTDAVDPEKAKSSLESWASRLTNDSDVDKLSDDLEAATSSLRQSFAETRHKLLQATQKAEPLIRTDVRNEDYVSVLPGGRYFQHSDGSPLIPIGYNHNPDWPEFEESNPERPVYDPSETSHYMAHLKASGVNVLRMMLETPPTGNLEDPIGTFSPEHVRWLDTIILAARKNDIKLIVTPWDTFWMNLRFDTTPYNPALGGTLNQKIDFITSPILRAQEKRRIRFIIDRWGNSGTIFSWELLNEADLWWGETPVQLHEWIADMAAFAKSYESKKWHRNHLLNVSIAEPMPKGALGLDAYGLSVLDYATTHLYIGPARAPTEAVGPALAIREGVIYSLGHISDMRPYMDTENGPIDHWIDSEKLDDDVFLGMIWAHLASGAAGSGFRWPYRNPHHLTEGMLSELKAMSVFAQKVPWRSLAGTRSTFNSLGEKGTATCGFGTRQTAVTWSSSALPMTIDWPEGPVRVKVRVFDCRLGKWLADKTATKVSGRYLVPLTGSSGPTAALLTSN